MLIGLTDIIIEETFFDLRNAKTLILLSLLLGTEIVASAIAKFDLKMMGNMDLAMTPSR